MDAISLLRTEHDLFRTAIRAAREPVREAAKSGRVRDDLFDRALQFLDWADRWHTIQEERVLYPVLRERRPELAAPLAVLVQEHRTIRDLGAAAARALPAAKVGEQAAVRELTESLTALMDLTDDHFGREENVVFAMADGALTADDLRAAARGFEDWDTEFNRDGRLEILHRLAREIGAGDVGSG